MRPSASRSVTAHAAAVASGFPPKVLACVPGVKALATSSRASSAPSGMPPAIPFASVIASGSIRSCWCANQLRCAPCRSAPRRAASGRRAGVHSSRTRARYPRGAGSTPPSPWIGLEEHRAGLVGDRRFQRLGIAVVEEAEALGQRPEPCWYLGWPVAASDAHRPPVERVVEAEDLDPLRWPLTTWKWRASLIIASFASAPLLQKKARLSVFVCAVSFSASRICGSVTYRFEACQIRPACCIRASRTARVRVADADGGDAADEVEVALSVCVEDPAAFAADQRDRLGAVVLEEDGLRALHEVLVAHGRRGL